jgi:hypothetical protein
LKCPNCGEEILDEDATVCPECGESLSPEDENQQDSLGLQQKQTDLVLAAALLSIISATFVASVGYLGLYQYSSLLEYYGSEFASQFLGFLIFGAADIVAAVFALIGGIFMLKRKRFIVSTMGFVLPLVSVFITYITIQQYNYGFTDILLFAEITVFILSFVSGILVFTSKAEFP